MPAVPVSRTPIMRPDASFLRRIAGRMRHPDAWVETVCWLGLLLWIAGIRWWLAIHLPTYVWSRDSGSYLAPALTWLQTGQWITSPRRGPVYSLFIAAILKGGGTLVTVANAQAIVGGFTTGATILMARAWLGRKAFWPLFACSIFLAFYGMPLELERLIRNETLLTLFSTVAFGAWFFALKSGSPSWIALSGFATGSMQLLKGIFPVFPLIVLLFLIWNWRRTPSRAVILGLCYLLPFILPLLASKLYDRWSGTRRPAEPEAGEMFYGRTAQWTYLDGGIVPDIKARIHGQVEKYETRFEKTGQLDNNEIVKRTVVPALKTILVDERKEQLVDVDHLCWRLGLEAVAHHPGPYLRQFVRDAYYLNFKSGQRSPIFEPRQLSTSGRDAESFLKAREIEGDPNVSRAFELSASKASIEAAARGSSGMGGFSRFIFRAGEVRLLSPAFLTTLLLPLLVWVGRGRNRLFWLSMALLWYFYLTLLSTVGRPLDRYLMPVVPIMFWTVSAAAALGWDYVSRPRRPGAVNATE